MKKCFYCGELKEKTWVFHKEADLRYCDDCNDKCIWDTDRIEILCKIIVELKGEIEVLNNLHYC